MAQGGKTALGRGTSALHQPDVVNTYLPYAPDVRSNHPVWIARYGEYKPDVRLAYWQLCADGRVNGIRGEVDINVFNGYKDEFRLFLEQNCIR